MSQISEVAKRDIQQLRQRIVQFEKGEVPEERFKAFRLTRGVYGQRQTGVHMFRIKVPYGRLNAEQLRVLADLSDKNSNGKLHATTRQNFQMHYVKLQDTPAMWEALEEVGVTTKEACGNTVRTVTASPYAGIDPKEPFDVSPYADAVTQFFLRNPICQDMGRKVKMAFSAHDDDSAFTYIHDFGMIPRVRVQDGKEERGFRVLIGGGLGAQAMMAVEAFDFLPEDELIPFIEAGLRVFDRYGERKRREKARMKFLLDPKRGIGAEEFLRLVEEERKALSAHTFKVETNHPKYDYRAPIKRVPYEFPNNKDKFEAWRKENVFEQKQTGFFAVKVRLRLGNLTSDQARKVADIVESATLNDFRVTINQGLLLRFATEEALPFIFNRLNEAGLADIGFGTLADITACPGTDTCNLGVTNSTDISLVLEDLLRERYPSLSLSDRIHIKISGCMNSCGQHMVADIGFHGSSIRASGKVVPALQVVMGGGVEEDGKAFIAEKIIKLPTKRIPKALTKVLDNYLAEAEEGESFKSYYYKKGKKYFYELLKPLALTTDLKPEEYMDWGTEVSFKPEVGVGECAGVSFDLVSTIVGDSEDRLELAGEGLEDGVWADSIYNSYSSMVIAAKALLLGADIETNTHRKLIKQFVEAFEDTDLLKVEGGFEEFVLRINKQEPSEEFANLYYNDARNFLAKVKDFRAEQAKKEKAEEEKLVVDKFYRA
ncbi:ferredoxin--nitrite reductase [Fulvitalea axinellae]|uniref:Ferredoxin--nitrite reductase n=1 Tax=Fulvitalea axinellae TaxID=1182444 RepID=A0AAU9CZ32_9BACT|nr:ferredoxin--nitrite reductase [Fulvitalea axinellae]